MRPTGGGGGGGASSMTHNNRSMKSDEAFDLYVSGDGALPQGDFAYVPGPLLGGGWGGGGQACSQLRRR